MFEKKQKNPSVLQEPGCRLSGYKVTFMLLVSDESSTIFSTERIPQSQPWVILHPQYARGRHFITAHDQKSATLQVGVLCMVHGICTRLRPGHLSVRVGGGLRCSEEIVETPELCL